MKAPVRRRRRKGARTRPERGSVVRAANDQDARDLAIMRRELRASGRAEGSIVDADIEAQRHLANVAAQWIVTRDRKHAEAEAQDKKFDEARFLKRKLDISTSTMRRWIIILRHWSVYERKRRAAGPTGHTGSGYARALIGQEISEVEIKQQGLPTRSGVQRNLPPPRQRRRTCLMRG
jgi:hypothetical protein